jgi:prepilin-type processing-associated H-X9-DG protein
MSNWVLNDTALLVAGRGSSGTDCFASFHKAPSGDFDKGVANVLFFDGSIAWHPPQDSVKLGWPPR